MTNIQKTVGVIAAVLAVGLLFMALRPGLQGPAGKNGQNGQDGQNGQTFGSLAGPDIPSQYLNWGGVKQYSFSQVMNATSSQPCQFGIATTSGQAWPQIGTSTILEASFSYSASGLGAQNLDISTTTINALGGLYGSSTIALVKNRAIGAGQDTVAWVPIASSTTLIAPSNVLQPVGTTGEYLGILRPGEGVTFRMATATAGTFSSYLTGYCTTRVQALVN